MLSNTVCHTPHRFHGRSILLLNYMCELRQLNTSGGRTRPPTFGRLYLVILMSTPLPRLRFTSEFLEKFQFLAKLITLSVVQGSQLALSNHAK